MTTTLNPTTLPLGAVPRRVSRRSGSARPRQGLPRDLRPKDHLPTLRRRHQAHCRPCSAPLASAMATASACSCPTALNSCTAGSGLSLIGAISVPINTAYKRDEAAYILNNAGATALVTHTSLLEVAQEAAELAPEIRHKLLVGPGRRGLAEFQRLYGLCHSHRGSRSRLSPRHLHAGLHLWHHRQP